MLTLFGKFLNIFKFLKLIKRLRVLRVWAVFKAGDKVKEYLGVKF